MGEFTFNVDGTLSELEMIPEREAALSDGRHPLQYAAKELLADRETMLAAVAKNAATLPFAAAELQADHEFMLAAVQKNRSVLDYFPLELQAQIREQLHV